jgi:Flp pilus assembly protein TadD
MIAAFVDVFPQAVLISGAGGELLLIGTNRDHIELDPQKIAAALAGAPAVRSDLERVDFSHGREIVGAFVSSATQLAEATRRVPPVTDDRPIQEYGERLASNPESSVPASLFVDLGRVREWCPKCFVNEKPIPFVDGLDTYLSLLSLGYQRGSLKEFGPRTVAGSRYLGALVPESAELHQILGVDLARRGRVDRAIGEFREAARLAPDSAKTHWHLGVALASHGADKEAIIHLNRAVALDPSNGEAHFHLAVAYLSDGQAENAIRSFRNGLQLRPDSAEAYHGLGIALTSDGRIDEAIDQFRQALALRPGFVDAQRQLRALLRSRPQD